MHAHTYMHICMHAMRRPHRPRDPDVRALYSYAGINLPGFLQNNMPCKHFMHTCTHAGGDGKESDDEGSSSDSTSDSDGSAPDQESSEEEEVLPSRGTYACLLIFNHILTCTIIPGRTRKCSCECSCES